MLKVLSLLHILLSHTVRHPRDRITAPRPSQPLPFYQFLPPSSSRDTTPFAQLSTHALQARASFETFVIPSKLAITWKYVSCLRLVAWLCHEVEGLEGQGKKKKPYTKIKPQHPTKPHTDINYT